MSTKNTSRLNRGFTRHDADFSRLNRGFTRITQINADFGARACRHFL